MQPILLRFLSSFVALAVFALSTHAARAQNLNVIRDAEVEQLMRDYASPIFKAAGINEGATQIILIGDRRFNAFVANGRRMFINLGAIMDSETPNELIGVIAHESGHIAGGHLARQRQQLDQAMAIAVIGTLIGAAAVGTAVGTGNTDTLGNAATGLLLSPQNLAMRNLLAYQRSEEQAADQAALNYLAATGQSAKGMLRTFQRFAQNDIFAKSGADPYLQSHPMAPERIANIQEKAQASPSFDRADPPALNTRHQLARAKLFGFTARFDEVARRYPPGDNSLSARYARAIALYRVGQVNNALPAIEALTKAQPNNPFFWELKGQVLAEAGRPAQALAPLRQAVKLAPRQSLIRALYGKALVLEGAPANLDTGIKELRAVVTRDRRDGEAWRYLARAYGAKGDAPRADLATAEAYLVAGRIAEAIQLAGRAKRSLKQGSPDWLRADDIAAGAEQ
jgi:predicted Zn-dependent protease